MADDQNVGDVGGGQVQEVQTIEVVKKDVESELYHENGIEPDWFHNS